VNRSLLMDIMHFDVIRLFEDWLAPGGGWYIDPETRKIRKHLAAIDPYRYWIYTNQDPNMHCHFYMEGVFQRLKFIHSRCLECYKVVVKMHTVEQLMAMAQWQKSWTVSDMGKDRFCKCGIELRSYTFYPYGAYFYTKGLEQGKLRHGQVYGEMQRLFGAENVSDVPGSFNSGKVEVILKRYCTEYEMSLGPTDEYKPPEAAAAMEKVLEAAFLLEKHTPGQPDYLIRHIMYQWLVFAWKNGDDTAMKFNNNEPLYTPLVTYHDQRGGTQ
jgi:hypothetical protein